MTGATWLFFFSSRRRHPRLRRDWSSDVCSSDLDGPYLKLTIGVILVVMSVAMLSGWSRPVKSPLLPLFPIGFLSGILQTTSAMSGPPIILFLTNQGMDKDRFRANILVYFALLGTISTVGYAWQGEFTQPVMQRDQKSVV